MHVDALEADKGRQTNKIEEWAKDRAIRSGVWTDAEGPVSWLVERVGGVWGFAVVEQHSVLSTDPKYDGRILIEYGSADTEEEAIKSALHFAGGQTEEWVTTATMRLERAQKYAEGLRRRLGFSTTAPTTTAPPSQ